MSESQLQAKGVSIWLGDFDNDAELNQYLNEDKQFEHDFGFDIYTHGTPEYDVGESKEIRQLLEGFYQWESFVDEAVSLASSQQLEKASCAVVFQGLKYDPSMTSSEASGKLRFLGWIAQQ